jgi:hypothetical protein
VVGNGDDDSRERTTVDDKDEGKIRSCGIVQYYQISPNITSRKADSRGSCFQNGVFVWRLVIFGDICDIGSSDNSHGNYVFITLITSIWHENFPHKQIPIHGKFP